MKNMSDVTSRLTTYTNSMGIAQKTEVIVIRNMQDQKLGLIDLGLIYHLAAKICSPLYIGSELPFCELL